ncbi:MAG: efflux RND transporter periplasmic adaptor subunit [Gammaproteobacteria bacterium]
MDKNDAVNSLKIDRSDESQPTRGRRGWIAAVIGVAVVAIMVVAGWWIYHSRPVTVHTMDVVAQDGGSSTGGNVLNASGYVVAEQQATVSSQITGMIHAVYVQEGMHVKNGQVLARLDDSAARADVAVATSQLQADRASVVQYQAQWVRDQKTLARTRTLVKQGLLSRADLDNAEAAVNIDAANIAHARGRMRVDENNLRLSRIELGYTVIRAPFSGMVTEKYANPGEMISPAAVGGFTKTGICMLVDMRSLELDVDVNEAYIQRVHAGQPVIAVLDAYPDWRIPAHVISVVPTANKEKATVKVRIAFDKLDPRILPQMGVQAWFYATPGGHSEPSIASIQIPEGAVYGSGGSQYVFLVEAGHIQQQPVKTAPAAQGQVRVLSGLNGGEQLVISADTRLRAGEAVRTQGTGS